METLIKKIIFFFENKYTISSFRNEDAVVLNFLKSFPDTENLKYFEAGSGLGRFPNIVKHVFPNFSVKCLDINQDLVNMTNSIGLNTVQGNIKKTPFKNDEFNIVHCSHVIEHLGYPEIISTLNELLRITNQKGYLIIRSPLMHSGFYFDIDHIRPYPPESILNYFNNIQQQKIGKNKIKKIKVWYRREALSVNFLPVIFKKLLNFLFRILWTYTRFPFSSKNGYILILKKE